MKVVLCEKKGPPDVLQIKEIENTIQKDDEIFMKPVMQRDELWLVVSE